MVLLPYEVARPYSIWVSDDSLVVQVIVAPMVVIDDDWIEEMVGGVVSNETACVVADTPLV